MGIIFLIIFCSREKLLDSGMRTIRNFNDVNSMKFIYFAGNGKEFNNLAWDFCLHIDTRLISPIRLNLNFAQNSCQNSLENQLEIIIIIRPKESLLAFLGIRITNDFAHKDKVKWSRRGSLPSSSSSLHSKFQLQCTIANKLCKQTPPPARSHLVGTVTVFLSSIQRCT